MRQRIYWLLPDVESARKTMNRLLLARIDERHIRFFAHEGMAIPGLPPAGLLQTSDVVPSGLAGLALGGGAGFIAAALTASHALATAEPLPLGMGGLLVFLGALFGGLASALTGLSAPSTRLRCFRAATAEGMVLLIVSVPRRRRQQIEHCLVSARPAAAWSAGTAGHPTRLARTCQIGGTRREALGYRSGPRIFAGRRASARSGAG